MKVHVGFWRELEAIPRSPALAPVKLPVPNVQNHVLEGIWLELVLVLTNVTVRGAGPVGVNDEVTKLADTLGTEAVKDNGP